MFFPGRQDVAAEAGVCEDSVGSFLSSRRPDTDGKIIRAMTVVGYVRNKIAAANACKIFEVSLCTGNVTPYLRSLQDINQRTLMVSLVSESIIPTLIKEYYCSEILIFNEYVDLYSLFDIDRFIVFVDCLPQNIFAAIDGFSPDTTCHLINFLRHTSLVVQIKRISVT